MPRVQSVGEYLDPRALVGEVKIEEGANIEITRDDSHNSLIISSTLAPYPQVASGVILIPSYLMAPSLDNPTFSFV